MTKIITSSIVLNHNIGNCVNIVEMAATKSIIADLNQKDKLNEKNYDVWHHKIQYVIEEQNILKTITQSMAEPEQGNTAQHRQDMEAYQAYKCKNRLARILLLSRMRRHNATF